MGYYTGKLMAFLKTLGYPLWSDNNVAGSEFMTALSADFTKTFSETTETFGSFTGTNKWFGGVLAPNGKIYYVPYSSTQVLCIDPSNNTTSLFGSLTGTNKWYGGVLAPNGKIYCVPRDSETILTIGTTQIIDENAVLSRYFNKF